MKIAVSMKSNHAYERLCVLFANSPNGKSFEFYENNIQAEHILDDVIEFWKPEYLILDSNLSNMDQLENLVNKSDIEVIYYHGDFDSVVNQITSLVEEEPIKEVKEIHHVPQQPKATTKIVVKDRIVEKEIYKTEYTSIPNKLIVIASLWSGTGSTTLATNLVRALAVRGLNVSYVEYPILKPYMFDYLAISSKETEDKRYTDRARDIQNRRFRKRGSDTWRENDIDWYVVDSRNEPIQSFTYEDMLKYIYSINSTITVVDVSSYLHLPDVQNFLYHADDVYVCIDPDPIKLDWLASIPTNENNQNPTQRTEKQVIDFLKNVEEKEGVSYQFVNMKYTKKVDNELIWQGLEKKPIAFFPVVDYETLIDKVWKSEFLYDSKEHRQLVETALKPIIVRSVPRKYYSIQDKKTSKMKSVLQVFKKGDS